MPRTDPADKGAGGISAFVVERNTPGVSLGKLDARWASAARIRVT
jgi:acyl-CoA dehydrogenase